MNNKIFHIIAFIIGMCSLTGCKGSNEIKIILTGSQYSGMEVISQFSIVDKHYNDSIKEFIKIVTIDGKHYGEDVKAYQLNYGDTIANGRVRLFIENVKIGEYNLIDGELEGIVTTWYPNGRIQSECHYTNGKRNGLCIFWDENKKVTNKMNFKDDIPID